jgi:lipopolysaccharide export LptBFGC system permease protein LptF
MLNETFTSFGLVSGFNPLLTVMLPAVLALAVGLWWLRRAY